MTENSQKLGEILVSQGLISEQELDKALQLQKGSHDFLGAVLIKNKIISEEEMLKALAEQFNLHFISLDFDSIDWEIADKYASTRLFEHTCFPIKEDSDSVTVAIADPLDAWTVSAIEKQVRGKTVILVLALKEEIKSAIKQLRKRVIHKSRRDHNAETQ